MILEMETRLTSHSMQLVSRPCSIAPTWSHVLTLANWEGDMEGRRVGDGTRNGSDLH
jgi:hypothetical protein